MERILRRNAETQKAHIDLWETNRLQLLEAGLLSGHIEIAGICTYIRYEDYFSRSSPQCQKRPDPYRDMLEKILVILAQTYNRHDFNHSFTEISEACPDLHVLAIAAK